jgi:hypothetical protein
MKGQGARTIFHLQSVIRQHLGDEIVEVDDFEAELSKMLGVVFFKGVVTFRTIKNNPLGPGVANYFQIMGGQFLEDLNLTVPEHIVTAAVFFVTHHRFDARAIEDFDNVLAHREAVYPNVPENDLKIGHAAHEKEGVALLGHFSRFLGPLGFLLVNSLGLEFHDGLKHAMMGIDRRCSKYGGFFSEETHKLWKIYTCGAALRATAASKAGPKFAVLEELVAQTQQGLFHNQTG